MFKPLKASLTAIIALSSIFSAPDSHANGRAAARTARSAADIVRSLAASGRTRDEFRLLQFMDEIRASMNNPNGEIRRILLLAEDTRRARVFERGTSPHDNLKQADEQARILSQMLFDLERMQQTGRIHGNNARDLMSKLAGEFNLMNNIGRWINHDLERAFANPQRYMPAGVIALGTGNSVYRGMGLKGVAPSVDPTSAATQLQAKTSSSRGAR
jgi:hypothetical protein